VVEIRFISFQGIRHSCAADVFVSAFLHPPHSRLGSTFAEDYFVGLLAYDSLILLFAALVFASIGPKGFALPTAAFGLTGVILFSLLLPALANAK